MLEKSIVLHKIVMLMKRVTVINMACRCANSGRVLIGCNQILQKYVKLLEVLTASVV